MRCVESDRLPDETTDIQQTGTDGGRQRVDRTHIFEKVESLSLNELGRKRFDRDLERGELSIRMCYTQLSYIN